jgi:amino acid permease
MCLYHNILSSVSCAVFSFTFICSVFQFKPDSLY